MKKIYLLLLFLTILWACVYDDPDEIFLRSDDYWKRPYSHLSYEEVIEKIKTPAEAAHYLEEQLSYLKIYSYRSFKYIHERGSGLCADYALAAAALLSDNDYPSLMLVVEVKGLSISHALYIYQDKQTKKWGTLGIMGDNSPGAIFNNLEELCVYVGMCHAVIITSYQIYDLSDINFIDDPGEYIYKRGHKEKKNKIQPKQEPTYPQK